MPAGAISAALTARTRNHVVTEVWFSRKSDRTSLVGSSRIWGYSKTMPRTVNPAIASRDARAKEAAATRACMVLAWVVGRVSVVDIGNS